jgi:hypothetical protein
MIRELGLGVSEVSQASLGGGLRNTIDGLEPIRHLLPVSRLEQIVPAILGIQLEGEGAVVVDELRDTGLDEADNERRLPRWSEIELLCRTLHGRSMDRFVAGESAGDGPHEVEEGGHALLAPLVLLLVRRRLPAHCLV